MAAVQECHDRIAPRADFLQSPANPEIAPRGHQPLFKSGDRLLRPAGLLVDLGQIQVELGVIVSHPQGFQAEGFPVAKTLLGDRSQQSRVGEIKGVLRRNSEGAAGVLQGFGRMTVAQLFEALLEIRHAGIGR